MSQVSAEAPQDEINWRDVCRSRLEKQKQLTTNRLMSAKQMLFDINQICVDLALVERKQPDKGNGMVLCSNWRSISAGSIEWV